MTTPNDLPSVGTEDAQEIAHGLGRIYQDTAADMLRSLVAERDELASRVRELEGCLRWVHGYLTTYCVPGKAHIAHAFTKIDAALNASKEQP